MFRADLHCHTMCSDGILTPEGIISKAKEIGLCGLSITDHDSIDAYQTAPLAAKEKQILLGSGVEFSCAYEDLTIHILAYDFDVKNPSLIAFCEKHRQRRKDRNHIILEKLKQHKIVLDEDELNQMGNMIGRPHIAKLLVKKGFVGSVREAFQHYIGDHKSCFYRGPGFSIEETLSLIHEAGGKAFIAHPHLLRSSSTVRNLLKMPFDGIECYYARIPADQERKWIKMAKDRNLLVSGGSDYHGEINDHNALGNSWVDEENFHKIFQHLL